MPETIFVDIALAADSAQLGWMSPHWPANVAVRQADCDSSAPASCRILIRNRALRLVKSREDVRWLMEQHATTDPFDLSKAGDAGNILNEFTHDLIDDILGHSITKTLSKCKTKHLAVRILHDRDHSVLYQLPWEVLHDSSLWRSKGVECQGCSVERVVPTPELRYPIAGLPDARGDALNILLVCIRPEVASRSPADLTSAAIARIVSDMPGIKQRVRVHMVRPGTWEALVRGVRSKPKGFFQLAHIDMHGHVVDERYYLDFVKPSAVGRIRRQKVDAQKVAELFGEHGVQFVSSNACQAARESLNAEPPINFARLLVRNGVQAAVAASFNAMASTMQIFIHSLYFGMLVEGLDVRAAAARASSRLCEDAKTFKRPATLGRFVTLQDVIVPVLYCQDTADLSRLSLTPRRDDDTSSSPAEDFVLHPELIGRTWDTLKIEKLLGMCPILLLHGQPGVGKTALAAHLSWWWTATGLARYAVYVDLTEIQHASPTGESIINFVKGKLPSSGSSFVLVLDSLESVSGQLTPEDDALVRSYLEGLVQDNQEPYDSGDSYIILISRSQMAFGWDPTVEISSYLLIGLPIVHGLALGWREATSVAAKKGKLSAPRSGKDSEERDCLEKIIQILDGNALAIKIVFAQLQEQDLSPRALFTKVLTGDLHVDLNVLARNNVDMRLFVEIDNMISGWMTSADSIAFPVQYVLGLFNLVLPRQLLVFYYLFTRALSSPSARQLMPDVYSLVSKPREAMIIHGMLDTTVARSNLDSLFTMAEDAGLIAPLETKKLLHFDSGFEFYYINPLFTIRLRDRIAKPPGPSMMEQARITFVQYRIWWEMTVAQRVVKDVPRDEWDETKTLILETPGIWNLVAAVIHAQEMDADAPTPLQRSPPIVRMLAHLGTQLSRFSELVASLRPYLVEELKRHLRQPIHLQSKNVNWMYSTLKLAYYLRYSGQASVWEYIEQVLVAAERFLALGGSMTGASELALMEVRTVQAARCSEAGYSNYALSLIERNLRFEPQNRDETFPAMKGNLYENLQMWARESARLQNITPASTTAAEVSDKNPTEKLLSRIADLKGKSSEDGRRLLQSLAEPVCESIIFKHVDLAKATSFSRLAQSIFNGPYTQLIEEDLSDPTTMVKLVDNVQRVVQAKDLDLAMALCSLDSGNAGAAKLLLQSRLEMQSHATNDSPTNYSIHRCLWKIAEKEEKWQTAVVHLKAMAASGQEGTWCYTWIEIAKCYDKLRDIENLRDAGLKALQVANRCVHEQHTSADRFQQLLDALRELTELDCIRDFSCVFPLRERREPAPDPGDQLNPAFLYFRILLLVYRPELEPQYARDGLLIKILGGSIHAYADAIQKKAGKPSPWPPGIMPELRALLDMIWWLMRDVYATVPNASKDGEVWRDAERWLFANEEPINGSVLRKTEWLTHQMDQRRSNERSGSKPGENIAEGTLNFQHFLAEEARRGSWIVYRPVE